MKVEIKNIRLFFYISLFVIFNINITNGSDLSVESPSYWSRAFSPKDKSAKIVSGFVSGMQNEYYLSGQMQSGYIPSPFFAKLNANGEIISGIKTDFGFTILPIGKNINVFGNYMTEEFLFSSYDNNLNPIFQKKWEEGNCFAMITGTFDNGFLFYQNSEDLNIEFLKVNESGNKVFGKKINNELNKNPYVLSCVNGDFLISWASKSKNDLSESVNISIARIDNTGKLKWTKRIKSFPYDYNNFYNSFYFKELNNGDFITSIYEQNENISYSLKIDYNGNLLWSKKYIGCEWDAFDITEDKSGNCFVFSNIANKTNSDILFFILNKDGSVFSLTAYDFGKNDSLGCSGIRNDRLFLYGTLTESYTITDHLFGYFNSNTKIIDFFRLKPTNIDYAFLTVPNDELPIVYSLFNSGEQSITAVQINENEGKGCFDCFEVIQPISYTPVISVEDNPLVVETPTLEILDSGNVVDAEVPVSSLGWNSTLICQMFSSAPPEILAQPQSQTVALGDNVTLSVVAKGTNPLAYQWKKDGTIIEGATESSYIISSFASSHAGAYTVTITNPEGSVTSNAAILTVTQSKPILTFNTEPDNSLVLTFTGQLQESNDGVSNWITVGNVSPYKIRIDGTKKFYRSVVQ